MVKASHAAVISNPYNIYLDDFGRHIIGCATKTVCCPVQVYLQFTHTEVGDPDVSVKVQ